MKSFSKINAPEIYAVPIQENGEPLVDLLIDCPDISVDQTRQYAQDVSKSISCVRKQVAERLKQAAAQLPAGIRFKIVEGHRSLEAQRHIFAEVMDDVRRDHPSWNEQEIYDETSTFVAPPDNTPPHSTGGAVDLTLMAVDGTELDMGADLNAGYSGICYTFSESISEEAKKNRQILIQAMQGAGFANYPAEWWHWSYGDRYWAFMTGASVAIYGSM
jgi:D-alanyl-D-alanine dipeptidase